MSSVLCCADCQAWVTERSPCRPTGGPGVNATGYWNQLYRDPTTIATMAKAPQGTTVPIEVYLNERYIPIRGWSSGHLLPTDR